MSHARTKEAERFKQVVKALVSELGSQAAAAEVLGVSTPYVGRIVRDEIASIRQATFDRVEVSLMKRSIQLGGSVQLADVLWDEELDVRQWALDFRLRPILEKEKNRPFVGLVRHLNRQIQHDIAHGQALDVECLRKLVGVLAGAQSVALAVRMADMGDQELLAYSPSLLRAVEAEFLLENDRIDAIVSRPSSSR